MTIVWGRRNKLLTFDCNWQLQQWGQGVNGATQSKFPFHLEKLFFQWVIGASYQGTWCGLRSHAPASAVLVMWDKQNLWSPGLPIWPLSETHKCLIPVPGNLIGIIQLTWGQINFPQPACCIPHSEIYHVGLLIWKANDSVHKCNATCILFCKMVKASKCPVLFWAVLALCSGGLSPDRIQDINRVCFGKNDAIWRYFYSPHSPPLLCISWYVLECVSSSHFIFALLEL